MRKILLLVLGLGLFVSMPAFAADITAAQMVQIDQTGNRNNVDITSGVVNTVDTVTTVATVNEVTHITNVDGVDLVTEVSNVTSVDLVDAVTEVNNVTSVDTVDTITAVTNVVNINSLDLIDTVTEVGHVTNVDGVDLVTEVSNVTSVDAVDLVTLGNFRIQDGAGSGKATVENGALWVKSGAEVGTPKSMYAVAVAVAADTEIDAASYTVTTAKTLYISNISLVSSGLATLRVLAGANEIARSMTTPSCQTAINPKYQAVSVAAGTVVTLMIKNRETSAMDIACSLEGSEK